jgi:hypothetical protein
MINYSQCPDQALRFRGGWAQEKMNKTVMSVARLSKAFDSSQGTIVKAFKSYTKSVYVTSRHYTLYDGTNEARGLDISLYGVSTTAVNVRVGDDHYCIILSNNSNAVKVEQIAPPVAAHRTRRQAMYLRPHVAAQVLHGGDDPADGRGNTEDLYQNQGEEIYMG